LIKGVINKAVLMNFLELSCVALMLFGVACGSSSNSSSQDQADKDKSGSSQEETVAADGANITEVQTPFREHGYYQLEHNLIRSSEEFSKHLSQVKAQKYWNNKSDYLATLEALAIDFKSMNLLLYYHTEGSGSVRVSFSEPQEENNSILITVSRKVPQIGTADMAYYGKAYLVSKNIEKVIFDTEGKRVDIINR